MQIEYLEGDLLKQAIMLSSAYLEQNKAMVDALNVFPVPDGDTGTNMSLTIASAAKKVQEISDNNIDKVAEAASLGSLMGARGNSGVILSQLIRGFAKGIAGKQRIDSNDLIIALQTGIDTAYKAVMKPVEGTILTVAREAATAARHEARQSTDILQIAKAALAQANITLAKTPELLPTLKQAGVVDAGGKGLTLIIEGIINSLEGGKLNAIANLPLPETTLLAKVIDTPLVESAITFQYCTEFILKGHAIQIDKIRESLKPRGDCLLVVGTPEIAKVHVHTNNPGLVLEYCLQFGELAEIDINNMREQSKQRNAKATAITSTSNEAKELGIVCVASGSGIVETMRSLGADVVITGGQTMNPSTEDLVNAIRQTGAKNVLILPNNSNVILAAEQAVQVLSDVQICVVPSKTIPQGITALIALDLAAGLEANCRAMREAIKHVQTGEITFAVRDCDFDGIEIKKDDIIGLVEGKVTCTGESIDAIMLDLGAQLITPAAEIVTIFYGADVSSTDAASLKEQLAQRYPNVEVELYNGGQPLYYYIISVE